MHQVQPPPDDGWMKWLPPSPHKEAILEHLSRARATLIKRGDAEAPLVQFEDGGLMELDKVRHDAKLAFYHAADPDRRTRGEYRATQYSDVCGSIDELKRVLAEEPEHVANDRDYLLSLLEDALYMERRMNARQGQYVEFGRGLAALVEKMLAVEEESMDRAQTAAENLRGMMEREPNCGKTQLKRLNELAETIRDVANRQEGRLREHKELAIEAFRAYEGIKGRRRGDSLRTPRGRREPAMLVQRYLVCLVRRKARYQRRKRKSAPASRMHEGKRNADCSRDSLLGPGTR